MSVKTHKLEYSMCDCTNNLKKKLETLSDFCSGFDWNVLALWIVIYLRVKIALISLFNELRLY